MLQEILILATCIRKTLKNTGEKKIVKCNREKVVNAYEASKRNYTIRYVSFAFATHIPPLKANKFS